MTYTANAQGVERARSAKVTENFSSVHFTLGFLLRPDGTTLLKRAIHGPSNGRLNGPRGHTRSSESSESCLARETFEETGYTVEKFAFLGTKHVAFELSNVIETVDIYAITGFSGKERFSTEGKFTWQMPNHNVMAQMWPDTTLWFRNVLEKKPFEKEFAFFYDKKRVKLLQRAFVSGLDHAKEFFSVL